MRALAWAGCGLLAACSIERTDTDTMSSATLEAGMNARLDYFEVPAGNAAAVGAAAWGVGEGLVSSQVSTDSYILRRDDLSLAQQSIRAKSMSTFCVAEISTLVRTRFCST